MFESFPSSKYFVFFFFFFNYRNIEIAERYLDNVVCGNKKNSNPRSMSTQEVKTELETKENPVDFHTLDKHFESEAGYHARERWEPGLFKRVSRLGMMMKLKKLELKLVDSTCTSSSREVITIQVDDFENAFTMHHTACGLKLKDKTTGKWLYTLACIHPTFKSQYVCYGHTHIMEEAQIRSLLDEFDKMLYPEM